MIQNMSKTWKILSMLLIALLFGLLLLVKSAAGQRFLQDLVNTPSTVSNVAENLIKNKQESKPVTLLFVGDLMLDRGVRSSVVKNYGNDYTQLFTLVTEKIQQADIAFGNLEGQVSDIGNNVGSKFSFRMDPRVIPDLAATGFDIVSFANNHIGDWNVAGFLDSLKRLDENTILQTGAGTNKSEARTVKIIEREGKKIGFLGFSDVGPQWMKATDTHPGILLANDPDRLQIIKTAKSQVDFLIVSYHWGTEYKPFNTRQKDLAETSIDAGADLIIGHHPHVPQDYAEYKGKLIFYSLGNFMFDQPFSEPTMRGMMAQITLNPDLTYRAELFTTQQDKTYKIIEVRPFDRERDPVTRETITNTCPKPTDPNQADKKLFPVSGDNSIGKYVPSNLKPIPKSIPTREVSVHCLTNETIDALDKMITDAKKVSLKLVVSSAYRSADIQETLFSNNKIENPDQQFPTVAKPEHSEHQLGTAVDFRSGSTEEFTLEAFGKSPEYKWMKKNAHLYGFVQSYQPGTESVTGYSAEPWHWRYVGIAHATTIHDNVITPYEYLKNLLKPKENTVVQPQ